MKRILKDQMKGAQSVYAFRANCTCSNCKTCAQCQSGSAVQTLANGASASYNADIISTHQKTP